MNSQKTKRVANSLPNCSDDERADIGLHFGNALADGRFGRFTPSWERREHQRVPTDPPLKLFGGQIPMDEPNTKDPQSESEKSNI